MDRIALASKIDHTNVKPEATEADIVRLSREAIEYRFHAVCVNPYWVGRAAAELRDQPVKVCSVVGFPLGASRSEVKALEAELAVRDGAAEVDMMLNLGALRSGDDRTVVQDIALVRGAIGPGIVLKVILEAGVLPPDLKRTAARLAVEAGADFVKTSTGLHPAGGATVADVRLLRAVVGDRARVKAAGGIRDLRTALAMLAAGADRIGTSTGVAILRQAPLPAAAS